MVMYDITDNRERRKTGQILAGYGIRVQKSVFECRCTRAGMAAIRRALDQLDLQTGFVLFYRIQENAKRISAGQVPGNLTQAEPYALVV